MGSPIGFPIFKFTYVIKKLSYVEEYIMNHWEKYVLSKLLNIYESMSSTGKNRRIAFTFTDATMPLYFDDDLQADIGSQAYEDIQTGMLDLQQQKLIRIIWQENKAGGIIEKVVLNKENLDTAYRLLGRMPDSRKANATVDLLRELQQEIKTPVASYFIYEMIGRLQEHKPIKQYLEVDYLMHIELFVRAIKLVEQNEKEYYLQEFSMIHFADIKFMEGITERLMRAFRKYDPEMKEWETDDILAEHMIYRKPNAVYLRGNAVISVQGQQIDLNNFPEGIGFSGASMQEIEIIETTGFDKVLTIENVTTFYRWQEERSLMIYLGGYHNKVRCRLLQNIYQSCPNAAFYYFGDIEWDGFRIYEHLCNRTGIPFQTYHMDVETFHQFQDYSKPLLGTDRKYIKKFLEEHPDVAYAGILQEMLGTGRKLEHACIINKKDQRTK